MKDSDYWRQGWLDSWSIELSRPLLGSERWYSLLTRFLDTAITLNVSIVEIAHLGLPIDKSQDVIGGYGVAVYKSDKPNLVLAFEMWKVKRES